MKLLLSIVFIPLIYFYGGSLWDLIKVISFDNPVQLAFVIALIGSTLLFAIFLRNGSFLAIFEHELTHNLWAIFTFKKPVGFQVFKDQGGRFYAEGGRNYMISLSPYFFLTFSFMFMPLFLFIQPSYYKSFMVVLGILTGFHTSTTIKETSFRQPDLEDYGLAFSFVFIIFGNIISYGIILSFVTGSWEGIKDFLVSGIIGLSSFVRHNVTDLIGK